MIDLVWAAPAEADLAAIDGHWWSIDSDYAKQLTDRIRSAAEFLRSLPAGGAAVEAGGVRKWRVARSPYLLLYRASEDAVAILRIYHDRQNWRPA